MRNAIGLNRLIEAWTGPRTRLAAAGAQVVEGPCERQGARGAGTSTYTRDPDGNLLEFILY